MIAYDYDFILMQSFAIGLGKAGRRMKERKKERQGNRGTNQHKMSCVF